MIKEYKLGKKKYSFFDKSRVAKDNIFTIMVGKNGTGKSRLLGSIIREFVDDTDSDKFFRQRELGFQEFKKGIITTENEPSKIIAVSTSAFDKYPLHRMRQELDDKYKYFGLRDLNSFNVGLSFITKIIGSLIEVVCLESSQFDKISNVLEYLGYTDKIIARFEIRFSKTRYNDILNSLDPILAFEEYLNNSGVIPRQRRYFQNGDSQINEEKVQKLIEILNRRNNWNKTIYDINISRQGIKNEIFTETLHDDLMFLIESGIVRLRDFGLTKIDNSKVFRINEASSGEQCIVTTFLGIACHISDNSLICIDEPEISLHPEWQQRYIRLLISTFKDYKGCHFIIATHSPQIISRLSTENCFILSMENGSIQNASQFVNHSADFQLANIFNSPGYQNEYLNRLSFSIMSKVAKTKRFDKEDLKNFLLIESQIQFMEEEDPIIQLYLLLKDLKVKYA
ncbi:MAG: putative ATP-binding protein involved in virulence [Crocinitomix sp.]|jgi:predicted ATP-binding protein involved in virulence